jgi:hypothetical protein
MASLAVAASGSAEEPIVHSTRLVWVDRRGGCAATEAFEEEPIGRLLSDLRAVTARELREPA